MQRRHILVLYFVLFSILVFAGEQDILTITHFSPSLNCEKTFQVYFPPSASADKRFPVLYILHGAYGSYSDWVSRTTVETLADNYRMILVFPDGAEFGWYVDSPVEKDSQYESYIIKDLIPAVDRMFPTVAAKEGRGIMGLSMGGHGAFLLSAKHPDMFISASSLSGILKITDHPDKWQIAGRLGAMADNATVWEANSVFEQAERFKDANILLLFDCGSSDTLTGAIFDARKLNKRLLSLGIPHIWREMPGTHSWNYWQEHLEEHLNFHQAAMLESTPNPERWWQLYFERLRLFIDENTFLQLNPPQKTTLCLFGSSSMQKFPSELLSDYHVFNRGIAGDGLGIGVRGMSHRMECSVFDMNPDIVFILNGRNDLGERHRTGEPSIARMIDEYESMILKINERLPNTRICIITCPPVRDKYAHLTSSTLSYNMELKNLGKKIDVPVIDLHDSLVDEDGLMPSEYTTDGLHITRSAEEILARLMIDFLVKALE